MSYQKAGKILGKYSWIFLLLAGIFTAGFGLPGFSPTALPIIQERGWWRMWVGFALAFVAVPSFKRGDKWSWLLVLSLTVWSVAYIDATRTEVLTPIFAGLALILGFRKVFPKKAILAS